MAKTRKLVRRRLTRGRRVQKGRGQTFGRLRTPFRTQKTSNTYNNVKTVSNNSNKANGTGNNLFTRRKPVGTPQLSVKKVGNAAITEANKERLKGSYGAYKLAVNQFIDKYKEFVKLLEAKNYNIKAIEHDTLNSIKNELRSAYNVVNSSERGGVRRTFLKDASSVLNDEEYSHLAEDLVKITQLIKGAYNPIMQENIRREEVLAQLESFHNIALLKSRLEALRRP